MMLTWKPLVLGVAGGALIAAPVLAAPVKIGASLPITGGLAINGQKHKDGYELCVELINTAGGLLGKQIASEDELKKIDAKVRRNLTCIGQVVDEALPFQVARIVGGGVAGDASAGARFAHRRDD